MSYFFSFADTTQLDASIYSADIEWIDILLRCGFSIVGPQQQGSDTPLVLTCTAFQLVAPVVAAQ
ncbi:hypothetical protein MKQ70_32535 [Chitinophaga sedimenti]|uniref:hypothetical protein n=1 Tax=Chitinophaga sedimenti TaxID=2033606 RepID=UPI002005376A|nr:hypothetical protein [Chitinophaga sedimenti]MCK7559444.1 hypothetical protein [Chitinophaga sedimenti]